MNELLYKGLMLGRNKKIAREEYLAATGQKEAARFSVSESEVLLFDVLKDEKAIIHIILENEGYLEIAVEADGEFIQSEDAFISIDSEKGNQYEAHFNVLAKKLHNGKNFAKIVLRTSVQEITVPVTVNNRITTRISEYSPKMTSIKITEDYLKFRMGRISQGEWQEAALKAAEHADGNTPEDLFFMLYKAHVYVISGDCADSENILEYVSSQLNAREDYSAELFAYFLYVKSLYEKEDGLTEGALESVRELYGARPSWPLLWICFYLDEDLALNPQRKLDEIKKLFLDGKCTSPVMYFEAFDVLRNNPELARGDAGFMLQVLNFAMKNEISEIGPALTLSDEIFALPDAKLSEINPNLAIRVFEDAYDKYPASSLSSAIARLLVYSGCRKQENHIFFERAVYDFADIPLLYNYYVYTLGVDRLPVVPERILSYFAQEAACPPENRAWFFADVIANRYENYAYKNTYEKIKDQITAFAYDRAVKGANGPILGRIYGHVLQNSGSDADLKKVLYKVSFVKGIVCKNKRMARALVFHREFSSYTETMLEGGKALVGIYTPNYHILFKDSTGNIYKNIEYELVSYEDEEEFAGCCIKYIPVSSLTLCPQNLDFAFKNKEPLEIIDFLLAEFKDREFTAAYDNELLLEAFERYKAEPVTDEVYEKLAEFLNEDISPEVCGRLIDLMIRAKRYSEAAEKIRDTGTKHVSDEGLRELAHVLSQIETEDAEFICELSGECLARGCADNEILRYMCKNYDVSLEVLLALYEQSSKQGIYNLPVAERILAKAAKEDKNPDILPSVLERCYGESENRKLVREYLEYAAARYLCNQWQHDEGFFEYIGLDLLKGESFSKSAKAAYLVRMSAERQIPVKYLRMMQGILEELVEEGIMLPEFKEYGRFFEIPGSLENTYIVRRISLDGGAPEIEYEIKSERVHIKNKAPMDMVLPGIYVKYFTLLFSETLTWSIEGGRSVSIGFSEMETVYDGSRFAMADEISRYEFSSKGDELAAALRRYYVKDELIKRLF